ncbi:beta-lactamase-like protein [Fimicolochytrium jonesii]|uniref:beta-lactamase-like protein n=1 Tax=Fimicolochytrium jonesii TaxID=1396493 RepID=UPI0022FE62C5|nr:beta-lactamase-like protein [Fimicolochytrium jonesii]KAI8820668.1 beta-lactamase-like protein [Fimicolochytrium jonesii]
MSQVSYNPKDLPNIEKAKAKGNEAHGKQEYGTAVQEYTKAIGYFSTSSKPPSPPPGSGAGSWQNPAQLKCTLHCNRSAAYLGLQKYEESLKDALAADMAGWYKPFFRQGEALTGLRRYEQALVAYERAIEYVGQLGAGKEDQDKDKSRLLRARIEQIVRRIKRTRRLMEDEELGFRLHQISPSRGDICGKQFMAPIQNVIFAYAKQMRNFIYFIENIASGECLVVDACWDINGVISYAEKHKMKIVGAIATHYHVDHVGGIPPPPFDLPGIRVDGLQKLLKKLPNIQAFVSPGDVPGIIKANPDMASKMDRLRTTADNETLVLPMSLNGESNTGGSTTVGRSTILQFIHTPGHSPGSQCILINGVRLLSGDTLFIGSCGRVDFPDSSVKDLYDSLQVKLAALPDEVVIFPGHDYGGEQTTVQREKQDGLLRPIDFETFRSFLQDSTDSVPPPASL